MKIYFLSSTPCALSLNGVFYGVTDDFERYVELSLADKLYCRFSPEGAQPLGFFLTEEITSRPPDGCEVYLVKDGIVLFAKDFPPSDFTLRPIAQKREGDVLATVFRQGTVQLSVESQKGYFNATLPPSFEHCEVLFMDDFIFLKSPETLGVFTKACEALLIERVLSYAVEGEALRATLPLSDRLGRTADCAWRVNESGCVLTQFTLRQRENEDAPKDGLLAYAFFESVLLRADCAPFLNEELQAQKEEILAFLGDFIDVVLTEEERVCGLVRKKGERLFQVDYFEVEVVEGKITDVRG